MEVISSFAIVVLAAIIHATFQLSISVLTLMSGHAIGTKTAHTKLLRLTHGFLLGATVMTALLIAFVAFFVTALFGTKAPLLLWATCCGILVGLGFSVWMFYYRQGKGTSLWIPRGFAKYLSNRAKATSRSVEAFSLGLTSVLAELLFIIAPILVSALVLIHLSPELQLLGVLLYTAISVLPLALVTALIGSGHKLSQIQKWRESNKRFLQFAAGSGLLVLGFYIYVDQVLSVALTSAGGY